MPWTVSIVYLHQTEKLTMGYLFLSLALAAGITKSYCGKRLGNATSVFLITWLLSVNRGVLLLVEVFLMLGVLAALLSIVFMNVLNFS